MDYKASMDMLAKVMTSGVTLLFFAIGLFCIKKILHRDSGKAIKLILSGVPIFFIGMLLVSWLYAPQSYTVDKDVLSINRPVGNVKIQRIDILEVRLVAQDDLEGTMRTNGNGGLFGYYGEYYNTKLGPMTLYATKRTNRILIVTRQGQHIIITPDDTTMVEKIML